MVKYLINKRSPSHSEYELETFTRKQEIKKDDHVILMQSQIIGTKMIKPHKVFETMNMWPSQGVPLRSFFSTKTVVAVSKDSCKVSSRPFLG